VLPLADETRDNRLGRAGRLELARRHLESLDVVKCAR
jgi:hypothetical protein